LLVVSLVALPAFAAEQQMVLDAIRQVESSGMDDPPDGDGGAAIGPFQIHRGYWQDAVLQDPSLGPDQGYRYEDCHDRFYAQLIVKAYMQRWVPKAWAQAHAEVIARTHNGGPDGAREQATQKYWLKVERELRTLSHP